MERVTVKERMKVFGRRIFRDSNGVVKGDRI